MFGIFKTTELYKNTPRPAIAETPTKTVNELVEEIHDTFYTEVDRLLEGAKNVNSLDTDKQALIDKCERLKNLGFKNTKEVLEAQSEINRLDELKRQNQEKEKLTEAINYFSFKYPNYKFITEGSVKNICNKYGLVYGNVNRYVGEVPDENLKHIENFKIDENDQCYAKVDRHMGSWKTSEQEFITKKDFDTHRENKYVSGYRHTNVWKLPMEIAAPIKDFNMEGMELNGVKISKIEIPDPVVLQPVIYGDERYYLIVTAWGLEASDQLVVNANHN